MADKPNTGNDGIGRREVLKGGGIAAMAAAAGVAASESASADTGKRDEVKNPYGTPPGYGISLPEYYRPT